MSNPIKPTFKTEWFAASLLVLVFLAAVYFYEHFPTLVPTHWNLQGEVDGYSRPFVAAFVIPLMMLGIYLIFLFLPYLDPKREEYASFATVYHQFKDILLSFLFIIYLMTGLNGIGRQINIGFWTPLLVGLLFVLIGLLLEKVKMNWFLGIRTPWTMSSKTVWEKTHKLSSRVLVLAGLLLATTVFVPAFLKIVLFIIAIVIIVLGLPVYSYLLYAREQRRKRAR